MRKGLKDLKVSIAELRFQKLFSLILIVFQVGLLNFMIVLVQQLIDGLGSSSTDMTINRIIILGVISLGYFVIIFTQTYNFKMIGRRAKNLVKLHFYKKIVSKDMKYFNKMQSGEVISKVFKDATDIGGYLGVFELVLLAQVLTLLLSAGLMFYYNYLLTLILIALIIVFFYSTRFIADKFAVYGRKEAEIAGENTQYFLQTLKGIKSIKTLKRESFFVKALKDVFDNKLFKVNRSASSFESLYISVYMYLSVILPLVGIALGVYFVSINQLTIGGLLAFYPLMSLMQEPTRVLAEQLSYHKRIMQLIDRSSDILEETEESDSIIEIDEFDSVKFDLEHFKYHEEDKTMLENFSLHVSKGEIISLKGESGKGKSTLLKLLMKYEEPFENTVYVNGVDVLEVCKSSLYDQVLIQDQQDFVFEGTLKDNLTLGCDYSSEEIERVIDVVQLKEFVNDYGLDRALSEDASNISGGQIKRICLARVLLRKPSLLLLDEPTAALDNTTAQNLINSLHKFVDENDMTLIVVSHQNEFDEIATKLVYL